MVTLEGDFLSRHGEVSGGSNHMVGEEIFSRRQEINRLQDQYRKLHGELEGAKLRLGQEDARLNEARVRLVKSSEDVNGLKMEELKLQALRDNHKNRLDSAERQMRSLEMDETRFQRETSQINEELKQSEELVESLNKKSAEIETQKDKLQSEINILHQKNSDRQSKIENLKIQSARLGERVRSSERELQSQQEKIAYSENQITRLNSEKQRAEELTVRLSEEIASLNEKEIYLMRSHEETVALVESVKSILAGLHGSCSGLELEVQEHNRSLRSIGQKLHELEVDSARLEENIRNAKDQIGDQAEPDPEKIRQEFGEISDTQLEAVKEKVSSFGPVNLAAISESKAVDERLEFLGNQETDLKKAVDTLHETIETINQTTRDRFMETFEKVNQQFHEIFPFLFGGGQGRLELTDSENPLETGVAIIVRPPGKRFQNMDLLSGGEKALTAVALIFSIFLISPSPFCLLDEVDAPLDDSNLSRFNSMLRKLSDRTQFIVVTHNKRSMEESDALFGVTMEEPGASKVVSVKFLN
jgi:chromosome segregation protein